MSEVCSRVLVVALVMMFSSACQSGVALDDGDGVLVQVAGGGMRGAQQDGVRVFRGIPYAAAPIGPLRWSPPEPAAGWRGTRDAMEFAAACPQPARRDRRRRIGPTDEDCLYLNVWTPAADNAPGGSGLPVMVWVHGGAFRYGAGSLPFYDGASFARNGVVLVTFNYRLGRLGFFAHPSLDGGGNFALMDQAAALRWVRQNIGAFGGDAGNVTVFGESAGGASVLHLLTSPKAEGLFDKAIIQSGGGLQIDRHLTETRGARPSLQDEGVAWQGAATSARALRAIPAQAVVDASAGGGVGSLGPVIDGDWVLDDPGARLLAGRFHRVPVLVGSNSYEASVLTAFGTDAEQLLGAVAGQQRLRDLYPDEDWADRAWGDGAFVAGARLTARAVAAAGVPAYLYHFDYVPERRRGKRPGAGHGTEIPFVFNTLDAFPGARLMLTEQDQSMARRIHSHWLSFARGGNPAGRAEGYWPAYAPDNDTLLWLGDPVRTETGMRYRQLDYQEDLWQQRRRQASSVTVTSRDSAALR